MPGEFPVYGASGLLGYINTYHQEKEYIGIVKDGSGIGRVMFLPPQSSCIGTMQYILPKPGYDINYIGYCLDSLGLKSYKQGAAIPHIYFKDYGERFVNVVDNIEEQRAIVAKINTEFAAIDQIKQNAEVSLDETKKLFNSILNAQMKKLEGYTREKVGKLFKTYSGGTPLKSHIEYYTNGTIPWMISGEVCQKNIKSIGKKITDLGLKNSSAKLYPIDTVVVAMYGATAGQAGILKCVTSSNQAVCGILPNKDFLPEFVYYWFVKIKEQLVSLARGGAQPNISQEKIQSMLIPLAPRDIQDNIVMNMNFADEQLNFAKETCFKITKECNALKQSVLRQIFE